MRFYEFQILIENHATTVKKMKAELPSCAPGTPGEAELDARLKWAKTTLVKEQALQWFTLLYSNFVRFNETQDPTFQAEFNKMWGEGDYQFQGFDVLQSKLQHFFAGEYGNNQHMSNVLRAIRPATTTVNALIANATVAEERILADNKKQQELANRPDIQLLQGDSIILPVGKYNWWLLPHASHSAESKAMGHCGTASNSNNYLLSLRSIKPVWPVLTFEWNKDDHMIYQSKGPFNAKPGNKFHPYILALMLSDVVSGISNRYSYQPANDFSVFDLSAADLRTVAEQKPVLIENQIRKYAIDILRAPKDIIRDYPNFRDRAISEYQGLATIIAEDGTIDQSNETWENAIKNSPELLIYAPDTLDNWEKRITDLLSIQTQLLGYASAKIRGNYNIMSKIIRIRPEVIETVPLRAPAYNELALMAVGMQHRLIESIPEKLRTFEICKAAVDQFQRSNHEYNALSVDKLIRAMNLHLFTKEQKLELTQPLVPFDDTGTLFDMIPDKDKTHKLVDHVMRSIRINHNLSPEEKAERARNVFEHTPKEIMTDEQYQIFAVHTAVMDPSIIPEDMWTQDFMRTYIIYIADFNGRTEEFLQSPMYQNLDEDAQFDLDSTICYITPNGFELLQEKYSDNVRRYLWMAKEGAKRSPNSLPTILDYIDKHFEEIEESKILTQVCLMVYQSIVREGHKTMDELVMPKGTTDSDYKDMLRWARKGECRNLIGLPDDLVSKNRKWYSKLVIENLARHGETYDADKLYNAIAWYSASDEIYADIFEYLSEMDETEQGYNITNEISLSSFAKTDFLYDLYPSVMENIFEFKIMNRNPSLIKEASNLFAKIFPEDNVEWFQSIAREAFRIYFNRSESNANCLEIFDGFNLNVLLPETLKYALEKAPTEGANRQAMNTEPMQQVYDFVMSKPAYEKIGFYIKEKFNLGPAEIVGDDDVEDVNDVYDYYDDEQP